MSIFPRPLKKVLDKIIPFSQEDKVPLFNLGSGTYDATTYLRGDGTWATPSGGSGSIPHGTATGTDTYAVTITGVTSYNDGDAFLVRFTNGNTTGATLNINGLGAVSLYRNNDGPIIGGDIENGAEMLCVYNSTTTAFQLIGTTPNTLISYVTNADSVTITKGQAVYAFGGQGDRLTVKLANNSSDATSAQTVGLVLSTSIAAGQKGFIIVNGLLDGLSILPTSTWADGDPVYLGATAGSITNVKPLAPNHLVYLGFVTTANNGSAGRMYVRVQNGYELYELHDVSIGSYGTKDVLWRDTATNLWNNKDVFTLLGAASSSANGYLTSTDWTTFNSKQDLLVSGTNIKTINTNSLLGSGDLTISPSITVGTTPVTSGTIGRIFFENGGNVVGQDSALFWDNTNKRLGVGASPSTSVRLDVRAQGALSTDIAFRVRNSADSVSLLEFQGTGNLVTRHTSSGSSLGLFHRADTTGFSLSTGTSGYGTGTGIEVQGTSVWVMDAGARMFRFTSTSGNDGDLWTFYNQGTAGGVRLYLGIGAESFTWNKTCYSIGGNLFGSNPTETNIFGIKSGTAPTTSTADSFKMYSADIVAGNAAAHYRTENGNIIKIYQETTAVASSTRAGTGGTNLTSNTTFDGYTLAQVVKALRNQGLLA